MTDRILRIASIIYALLFAIIILSLNRNFYHDDSYITLRYARNYIDGLGIVWNPGEYVQGYTNFLHLIFIAFLGRLGIDLILASRLIGVTAFAALLLVMVLFGINLKDKRGNPHPLWHLPVILVATSLLMLVWSLGGLEGTLFSLSVSGGCLLFIVATESLKKYWMYFLSGILFGLSFLVRPDAIVFIVVSGFLLLWQTFRTKSQTFSTLMAYVTGVAMVVTPYIVWQAFYYGDVVPNTFYVKAGTPLWLRLNTGFSYMTSYLVRPPFLPVLAFIFLIYASLNNLWSSKLTYLSMSVFAYLIFIIVVGGDHMPLFRLLLPVIPLMSVMLAVVLAASIKTNGRAMIHCITFAMLIISSGQVLDRDLHPHGEDSAASVGTIVGKYIAEAWPAGSLIALNTAGSTPYYAGTHRYIDMLGLNEPAIARRNVTKVELPLQRRPGHLKGDGGYVLSRHPDFIIVGPAEGAVASQRWFLSDLELNLDPHFHRDYAVYKIFLDRNGHQISEKGIPFTYYKRITTQGYKHTVSSSHDRKKN